MNGAAAARGRIVSLASGALLLSGLYFGWRSDTMEEGWRWCMRAPQERDGDDLVFPLWTVTAIEDAHHYEISGVASDVPVDGDATGLKVGSTVSVLATFDWNQGAPVARETYRQVHTLRKWKQALGVIGFILVSSVLPFCFVTARAANGERLVRERTGWPEPTRGQRRG